MYAAHGFDFYDFQDPGAYGGSDAEMVNVTHGSEKMYLRFFIKMAESSQPLGPFVDVPALKRTLAQAEGNYEVFPLRPSVRPDWPVGSGSTK